MCVPSAFSMYLYIYILLFLHVYGHLSAINYLLLLLINNINWWKIMKIFVTIARAENLRFQR